MAYTLYYLPGACSMAVHVVLNELGQQVKLENVGGDSRPPEFLKINPRGNVPVLMDDNRPIREGAAIIIYLLDKYNSPLLPRSGQARAEVLEWLMFCNATLHPAFARLFGAGKFFTGSVEEKVREVAIEQLNMLWTDVETRLSHSPYLAGTDITAGDILLTVIGNWSANFPALKIGPSTKKLFKTVIARPAYQKALQAEKVEYKAAA